MPERNYRFNMMLSDEEERMLRTLAERRGLTASDLLRQTIRTMYESDPAFQTGTKPKKR
jgi:hypothetical protein